MHFPSRKATPVALGFEPQAVDFPKRILVAREFMDKVSGNPAAIESLMYSLELKRWPSGFQWDGRPHIPSCLSRVGSRKFESFDTICTTFEGSRDSEEATACI